MPLSVGESGLPPNTGFCAPKVYSQTASSSVRQFFCWAHNHDQQTDRRTDHATCLTTVRIVYAMRCDAAWQQQKQERCSAVLEPLSLHSAARKSATGGLPGVRSPWLSSRSPPVVGRRWKKSISVKLILCPRQRHQSSRLPISVLEWIICVHTDGIITIIIIMQRLTRRVSVARTANRWRGVTWIYG